MKRIALVIAASLLGTGCIVTDNHHSSGGSGIGAVNVYWEFVRTKLDQNLSTVLYDPFDDPNVAPGTGACTTSGVDVVRIEGLDAAPIDVDCRFQGVQGVNLPGLAAGTYRATISGWRGQAELYATSVDVVVDGGRTRSQSVQVFGIPDNFQVAVTLATADGTSAYLSCSNAGVTELSYNLLDFAGTVVATSTVPCVDSSTIPPGFTLAGNQALDRDRYSIRLQAFSSSTDLTADFDTSASGVNGCVAPRFGHFGNDTGGFAWDLSAYEVRAVAPVNLCP